MKFSYNRLKELSGTEKTPAELAECIMFHTFEVESVDRYGHGLESVVIGLVESVGSHPDADRLRVTTVSFGDGGTRTIVCGAPNVAEGQKVAVALPGAKLPGGIEIKDATIRGIASSGMICAEDELGLGSDHEGILVLPEDAQAGTSFAEYAGFEDTILDVNILPNRGCDAISYHGMAREIAALEGRQPLSDVAPITLTSFPESAVSVSVETDRCRRYVGILFQGVTSSSSPLWLKSVLLRSGIRPIGIAVDITNYALLEYGQPMHAFDADKIIGGIVVRQAREGESLILLDGKTIALSVDDTVIADEEGPLALAGVMGGNRSGITSETTRVFLEVATFDPSSIRKTASLHRLSTDASYRFERNVDTERATPSAIGAIRLFVETAGASVLGVTDVTTHQDEPVSVRFAPSVFKDMFGTEIPLGDAKEKLGCLGVVVTEDGDEWIASVPTSRPDLRDAWDFAEEVGRMIGYDAFPSTAPHVVLSAPTADESIRFGRELRTFLASSGFDEIKTYSFYSDADAKRFGPDMTDQHLRLANPMNPDQTSLRASLLPSALHKTRENLRFLDSFRFFELGDRYQLNGTGEVTEERTLSIVIVPKKGEDGFASLKGALEKLFRFAKLADTAWEALPEDDTSGMHSLFHPTRTARISISGRTIGVAGEIGPAAVRAYGLRGTVVSAQLSFDLLRSSSGTVSTFQPLPKFPYATRDVSLTVSRSVTIGQIERIIREASPLLRQVEVFDIYEQEGEKKVAFHLSFGFDDRTVTGEEVGCEVEAVFTATERECSAKRSA